MTTYYTYDSTTKRLTRASDPATIDGQMVVHPSAAMYASIGAYPARQTPPPVAPDGKIAVPDGYALEGGEWVRQWKFEDAPPAPPRRWTRLTIKGALADAHLLPAAKEFLAAYELKPDYTALEAFGDCDYIEEGYGGDETWNALLNGAANALGKTRAEIDAFLDTLPTEG